MQSELKKLTEERAGEIATALIERKVRRNGFSLSRIDLQDNIKRICRKTGLETKTLETFVVQVMLPVVVSNLGNISVNMAPKHQSLSKKQVGEIARAIVVSETSLSAGVGTSDIDRYIKDGVQASREELIMFQIDYVVPAIIRALNGAKMVSISCSLE